MHKWIIRIGFSSRNRCDTSADGLPLFLIEKTIKCQFSHYFYTFPSHVKIDGLLTCGCSSNLRNKIQSDIPISMYDFYILHLGRWGRANLGFLSFLNNARFGDVKFVFFPQIFKERCILEVVIHLPISNWNRWRRFNNEKRDSNVGNTNFQNLLLLCIN